MKLQSRGSPLGWKEFLSTVTALGCDPTGIRGWIDLDEEWAHAVATANLEFADGEQLPSRETKAARAMLNAARERVASVACATQVGFLAAMNALEDARTSAEPPYDDDEAARIALRDTLIVEARRVDDPVEAARLAAAALMSVWQPYPLLRAVLAVLQSEAGFGRCRALLNEMEWSRGDVEAVLPAPSTSREAEVPKVVSESLRALVEARRAIIRPNQLQAFFLALRHVERTGVALEQAWADAKMALIKAVDRYDPRRGYRFVSYAQHWVLRAMEAGVSARGKAGI